MGGERNRLADANSPYLLQHRDNPVWWQPWGAAAFAEARRRDAPIFLSVGYSTCHWCHVMERECFEDAAVARALNEGFVAIKVDREERPDVDALYMDAVQALTRQGGWPMSVWLTPDGRPFFAGTYFPRDRFLQALERVGALWRSERARLLEAGALLVDAMTRAALAEQAGELDASLLAAFLRQWRQQFDPLHGGRAGAPKFPPAYDLQLLLRIHRRSGDPAALEIVRRTLDAMAAGGICDHVGGGFHRYSTDARWLVPHFEKMLYDQAALADAYLDGFLVTGSRDYELIVHEILDYVLADLTHPDGALHSAEDADSEGEEGAFYVWTPDELRRLLAPQEADEAAAAFGVTPRGNFEGGATILRLACSCTRAERSAVLSGALAKLRTARAARVRPHLDDQVLTDWNGLTIAALARAGRALGAPRFIAAAQRAARFLLNRLRDQEGGLLHRWRANEGAIRGFLDDYAFFVHGLLELYQADFDVAWLAAATDLQARQDALFWDAGRGDYFSSDGADSTVILRRIHARDAATPAGRSVAALNLLRLARLLLRPDLEQRAAQVFASTPAVIRRAPTAFAFLLMALDHALDRSKAIAVAGALTAPDTQILLTALNRRHQPNQVLCAGEPGAAGAPPLLRGRELRNGRSTAYVCERRTCSQPITDAEEAVRLASSHASLVID